MHPDNGFYGHRRVLLDYVGEATDMPLWAHVQHGWQLGTGLNEPRRLVPRLPKLVWSERNLDACHRMGIKNVQAIGAPFVYLATQLGPIPVGEAGTIVYPFHSWERGAVTGSHHRLAAAIREREVGPVTVCLYHLEYRNAAIRRSYEDAGFRVICHGNRDGDADFLHRQWEELRRHRRVVSNRVSTAIFYGAFLGRAVEVYGPHFELGGERASTALGHERAFPELIRGGVDPTAALELGVSELGASNQLDPADLRTVLGIDEGSMRSRLRALYSRTSHHARRINARVFP